MPSRTQYFFQPQKQNRARSAATATAKMAKRSKKQVSEFGDQNSKPQGANVEEKMQKTTAVQTNQANPNGESLTEMHHQQQQNQIEPVSVDPVVTTTASSTMVVLTTEIGG